MRTNAVNAKAIKSAIFFGDEVCINIQIYNQHL